MKSRILSGAVALAYVAGAYWVGGGDLAIRIGVALVLPLACIWFGEAMGGYGGTLMLGGPMARSPGRLVAALGWLLLLLPVVVVLIFKLKD
jgi:hypothetical protein